MVEAPSLLNDFLTRFQRLHLAPELVFHRLGNELEAVQVFHFRSGSERLFSFFPDGEVYVHPQRALVHFTVGHPGVKNRSPQLPEIGLDFLYAAEIRLGNNLDQRHAAPVVIDQGSLSFLMDQLPGILLNMDSGDSDALASFSGFNVQISVLTQGEVILGNLIRLGKVGIKIVFSVLLGIGSDTAVNGQPRFDRIMNRLAV